MGKAESKELIKDDEFAEVRVIAEKLKYTKEHISRWKYDLVAFAINEMEEARSKELTKDDECAELRMIAEKQGPFALYKYRQEHISRWENEKLAFAITGRTATGKSTFINKMNDVKPGDIGFAKSGSGNTTKEPTAYQNPHNKRIEIYDLPGIGTMEFPRETYGSKMKLERYDYFFIFFDKVVSEDDYFLVCMLIDMKKSFCLVRSKIDDDLRNAEDDGKREEDVIPAIRKQINEQISRYEHLKNSESIFLISSKRKDIGDWPQLLCHVENCLAPTKFESLIYSIPTLTEYVIDVKYKTLRKRIKLTAVIADTIAAIPLPGLDLAANMGILVREVKHYIKVFGLEITILDTLAGLDRSQLKSSRFLVPGINFAKIIIANLGKYMAGILVVESVADIRLPIAGSIISAGTSLVVTYRFLNSTLDDFRDDARLVYRFILDKQKLQS